MGGVSYRESSVLDCNQPVRITFGAFHFNQKSWFEIYAAGVFITNSVPLEKVKGGGFFFSDVNLILELKLGNNHYSNVLELML